MNLEKNINNKLSLYFIIFLMFLGCEINKKSVQSNDYNSEYEIKNKSNISLLNRVRANPSIYIEGNGDNAKVYLKGVSSINFPKEILFVLNGIQVGNYSKISSMLDPTMIKSIRILKNAVDLSMYGFAGSGGVIEIKTK